MKIICLPILVFVSYHIWYHSCFKFAKLISVCSVFYLTVAQSRAEGDLELTEQTNPNPNPNPGALTLILVP